MNSKKNQQSQAHCWEIEKDDLTTEVGAMRRVIERKWREISLCRWKDAIFRTEKLRAKTQAGAPRKALILKFKKQRAKMVGTTVLAVTSLA